MSRAKKFFAQAKAERQALEDARPKSWELRPWSSLDALLVMSLAQRFHPGRSFAEVMSGKPKKFLDICYGLSTKVNAQVLATTVMPILKSAMPFQMLDNQADVYLAFEKAVTEFVENKCHGMVIHNSTIYPVKLTVEDREAYDWGRVNEPALRRMAAMAAMDMLDLPEIRCNVMLFANFGFSHGIEEIRQTRSSEFQTTNAKVKVAMST